jgi:hypothetical protein
MTVLCDLKFRIKLWLFFFFLGCVSADNKLFPHLAKCFSGDPDFPDAPWRSITPS